MTAKAIGKKIKAKGLQKLKFYCQMCQKQCRDANGFKCHMTSEAHQRQLLLFADNPNKYLGSYSDEFLKNFLYLLRTRFGTRRVAINSVYQEYIKDRHHTHLNATRWVTLTGLAKWMGRKGIAHVEETEKGWFVTYIDREHETMEKQKNRLKKEKLDRDYEDRISKIIEEQIGRGKAADKGADAGQESAAKELLAKTERIAFSLRPLASASAAPAAASSSSSSASASASESVAGSSRRKEDEGQGSREAGDARRDKERSGSMARVACASKRRDRDEGRERKSALELVRQEEERTKAKRARRDHWLTPGIIVKVVSNRLGDRYYKKKAQVIQVVDKYAAVIEMQESGDKLKVDQDHLESVIPNVGRSVRVVNGPYTGADAKLLLVNFDSFSCKIMIESGPYTGRVVEDVQYDEVCKRA